MLSALRRGMAICYGAFIGARSTLIAQLLIVTLLGAITIVGMGYVEKHESRTAIADWIR